MSPPLLLFILFIISSNFPLYKSLLMLLNPLSAFLGYCPKAIPEIVACLLWQAMSLLFKLPYFISLLTSFTYIVLDSNIFLLFFANSSRLFILGACSEYFLDLLTPCSFIKIFYRFWFLEFLFALPFSFLSLSFKIYYKKILFELDLFGDSENASLLIGF